MGNSILHQSAPTLGAKNHEPQLAAAPPSSSATSATLDLVQEALILRSWGWSVFPVRQKRPAVRWGPHQRRRPSDRELERMLRLEGVDGIAVVTGPVSGGLVNRDYDDPDAYHRWARDHRDLARIAPTVRTRRGFRVCARTERPVYRKFRDGSGEVIGDSGHYVVMPPSRHPKGGDYEWVNGPPLWDRPNSPLLDPFKAGFLTELPASEYVPTGHKAFCWFFVLCWLWGGRE